MASGHTATVAAHRVCHRVRDVMEATILVWRTADGTAS